MYDKKNKSIICAIDGKNAKSSFLAFSDRLIGFNMGEYLELLDKDESLLDIVFTIEKVRKNGMYYPQIRLKDLRIK